MNRGALKQSSSIQLWWTFIVHESMETVEFTEYFTGFTTLITGVISEKKNIL